MGRTTKRYREIIAEADLSYPAPILDEQAHVIAEHLGASETGKANIAELHAQLAIPAGTLANPYLHLRVMAKGIDVRKIGKRWVYLVPTDATS